MEAPITRAEAEPTLLVSIVTMNNRELLRRCLRSIPAACGNLRHDIVVVDNTSTDDTPVMIAADFPDVRILVNSSPRGFSANHNQILLPAMQTRSHDFVCILNDDTELDPGSLLALVQACRQDPGIGVAGPLIRGADGRRQPSLLRFPTLRNDVLKNWLRQTDEVASHGWLNGSCLVLALDTLRAVGPLDQRFFLFYEDTDLSRRVVKGGYTLAVVPHATMLHHGHASITDPKFGNSMELQMVRSRYLYYEKHFGRIHAAAALLVVRMTFAGRAVRAAIRAAVYRKAEERSKRDLMLSLIRYDPRQPLGHEAVHGP